VFRGPGAKPLSASEGNSCRELKRVTEERDILKKPQRTLRRIAVKYGFIRDHHKRFL
jgi:hypothetical protein